MTEEELLFKCQVKSMNLHMEMGLLAASYHITDIFREDFEELSLKRRKHSDELYPKIRANNQLIRTLQNAIKIIKLTEYQEERNNLYKHFTKIIENNIQKNENEIKIPRCIRKRIKKLNSLIKSLENRIFER